MKIAKRMKMMKIMKYNSYMEVKKYFFLNYIMQVNKRIMSLSLVEYRLNNEQIGELLCLFFTLILFIYVCFPKTNEYYFDDDDDDSDDDDDEYDDIIHREDFKRITRSQTRMKN